MGTAITGCPLKIIDISVALIDHDCAGDRGGTVGAREVEKG